MDDEPITGEVFSAEVGQSANVVGGYALLSRLGQGAMGEVHLARSVHPGQEDNVVAIKMITRSLPELAMRSALAEAFLLSLLNHPNVIRTYEAGTHDGALYVVMDYNDGPDLQVLSEFLLAHGLRLPEPVAIDIFHQLLAALIHVHEAEDADGKPLALVHRDICPGNLFVDSSGRVCLADFGISLHNDSDQAQRRTISGHLGFMSPEALQGARLDQRSDLFSLGCVFYTLLTGQAPFSQKAVAASLDEAQRGKDLSQIAPVLRLLLARFLAPKAAKRFASAREAKDALVAACGPSPETGRATLAALARACRPSSDTRFFEPSGQRVSLVSSNDEQINMIYLVDAGIDPVRATVEGILQRPPNRPVVFDMDALSVLTPAAVNAARFKRVALIVNQLTQPALDTAAATACQFVTIAPHNPAAFANAMRANDSKSALVHAFADARILLLGLPEALSARVTEVFLRLKISVDTRPRDRSYHLLVHANGHEAEARAMAASLGYQALGLLASTDTDAMDLCESIETMLGDIRHVRCFTRVPCDESVSYSYRGIGDSGQLRDVSRLGALLLCERVLHVGDRIRLSVRDFSVSARVASLRVASTPERRMHLGLDLSGMSDREERLWLRSIRARNST